MSINPIAEIRKELKTLSRKELATKMGVDESYLSLMLSGQRGVGEKVLKYLKLKVVYERR